MLEVAMVTARCEVDLHDQCRPCKGHIRCTYKSCSTPYQLSSLPQTVWLFINANVKSIFVATPTTPPPTCGPHCRSKRIPLARQPHTVKSDGTDATRRMTTGCGELDGVATWRSHILVIVVRDRSRWLLGLRH
jgi:hypothetical protein